MGSTRKCPECGLPVSRGRVRAAATAHEMLKVRDRLAWRRYEADDFCREGLRLAHALHAESHRRWSRVRWLRRSKRWLREGRARISSTDRRGRPPVRPVDPLPLRGEAEDSA